MRQVASVLLDKPEAHRDFSTPPWTRMTAVAQCDRVCIGIIALLTPASQMVYLQLVAATTPPKLAVRK